MKFLLPLGLAFCVAIAPAQVLINECTTGNIDAIEIVNLGSTPVNLSGWRLEYGGPNAQLVWVPGTFNFPSVTLAPEQAAVISESATTPATPPGTLLFTGIQNINWATSGGTQTRGGAAILVNPQGVGVDMVLWLGASPPNTFGATFTGSFAPSDTTIARNSRIDTNTPADWSSLALGSASFGLVNPSQVLPSETYDLSLTASPAGLNFGGVTDFPPLPNATIYNLPSAQNLGGNGPLFGVGLDALIAFQFPFDANGVFFTALDASGAFQRFFPGNFPPGLHLEVVSLVIDGSGIARVSNVAILDL